MMKIKLVGLSHELLNAWTNDFKNERSVEIIEGDITKVECDAIVSPANSFGFMDGGLDYSLSVRFGWDLQDRLQEEIRRLEEGELLVGRSITMNTDDVDVPYLISAPTMRVPMNFNIQTSVNAYLAMKAALIACIKKDEIRTVAIPGMCTGCGKMPAKIASTQMYLAYREVILGEKQKFGTFGEAQKFQNKLNEDSLIWY